MTLAREPRDVLCAVVRPSYVRTLIHCSWCVLFVYVSLVPFYYLQPVRFSVDLSTVTIAKYLPVLLIAFIAVLTLLLWLIEHSARYEGMLRRWGAVVGWYLVTAALSVVANAEFVWIGVLKLSYYTLTGVFLSFLLVSQLTGKQTLYGMVRCMIFVATLVALYGITVYVSGNDYLWGAVYWLNNPQYSGVVRIGSTLGNPNFVGSYLALCLPHCLWAFRFVSSRDTRRKAIYGSCLGIVATGLWLTFSRGGWLAGGVAIGVCLFSRSIGTAGLLRKVFSVQRVLVFFVVMLLLGPVIESAGFEKAVYRAWNQSLGGVEEITNLTETQTFRLAQYGTTWRVLKEYPLLGVGFGNFTRLFDKYRDPSIPLSTVRTTDNMYLMVACESGMLGLISFLGMLLVLGHILYARYRSTPSGRDRDLCLSMLAAFCGFLVNMTTWDALNQPTVRITFWMLIGLALYQDRFATTRCCGSQQPSL